MKRRNPVRVLFRFVLLLVGVLKRFLAKGFDAEKDANAAGGLHQI
jgi:hypothetical protein